MQQVAAGDFQAVCQGLQVLGLTAGPLRSPSLDITGLQIAGTHTSADITSWQCITWLQAGPVINKHNVAGAARTQLPVIERAHVHC